ncbi:unnamed protein product [Effrenium voratum]|nr:unnamed protein product [Effrenium voratum]
MPGDFNAHSMRSLIRHLLKLSYDDPQLARLAAAAVLVRDGPPSAWSTQEMELQRQEVKRLENAWRRFLAGTEKEATEAALHLAFREMEAAVRQRSPIPHYEELLLRVARMTLGGSFSCRQEVEAAVTGLSAGLSAVEEALSSCLTSRQAGAGSASRVACLVGAMLSPKELLKPEGPPIRTMASFGIWATASPSKL